MANHQFAQYLLDKSKVMSDYAHQKEGKLLIDVSRDNHSKIVKIATPGLIYSPEAFTIEEIENFYRKDSYFYSFQDNLIQSNFYESLLQLSTNVLPLPLSLVRKS